MAWSLLLLLVLALAGLVWVTLFPWRYKPDFQHLERLLAGKGYAEAAVRWTDRVLTLVHFQPRPDSQLARDLILSGFRISLNDLYVYKTLLLLLCLLTGIGIMALGDPLMGCLLLAIAGAGWGLPDSRVRAEARRKRDEVQRRLPALLQALAMMTEAGMNLHPAIRTFIERDVSTLGAELALALHEMDLGLPLGDALLRMAARCQVDDLYRAVAALIQAGERGGAGLSDTCREMASEAWLRRKDDARELGQQASTKMFLPLMLLVLPTVFLFMIGPAIYSMFVNF